jgi:hypothetical protein
MRFCALEAQDAGFTGAIKVAKTLTDKSKKSTAMTNEQWEDLDAKTLSTIHLCLADDVMFNIVGEDTILGLWSKLESLYMMNSLLLINILFIL